MINLSKPDKEKREYQYKAERDRQASIKAKKAWQEGQQSFAYEFGKMPLVDMLDRDKKFAYSMNIIHKMILDEDQGNPFAIRSALEFMITDMWRDLSDPDIKTFFTNNSFAFETAILVPAVLMKLWILDDKQKADIRKIYRKLQFILHPDKEDDPVYVGLSNAKLKDIVPLILIKVNDSYDKVKKHYDIK